MSRENIIETDVLVIGGGLAGLFASIKARGEGVKVTLVDKNYVSRSGSSSFCDGHFLVFNPEWGHDLEFWKNRIAEIGEYVNNPEWTEIVLKESYRILKDMMSWGVDPARDKNGEIKKLSFSGNQIAPINLPHGWTYMPLIRRQAVKVGVTIMDKIMVTDLLKQDEKIVGAVGFSTRTGEFYVFKAKATVMSAGGGNFKPNQAAPVSDHLSYDGDSMAFRAGAEISGKDFTNQARWGVYIRKWKKSERVSLESRKVNTLVSDYPKTAFFFSPMVLAGDFIDAEGNGRTQFRQDEMVAIHEGRGPILLDYDRTPPEVWEMLNNDTSYGISELNKNVERFKKVGLDPRHMTGLWSGMTRHEFEMGHSWGGAAGISSTDTHGSTSLPGLFAAGDAYHNAAVGAAYPSGGTGTRSAAVTGAIAGRSAAEYAKHTKTVKADKQEITRLKNYAYAPLERKGGFDTEWVTMQIQNNTLPYYILYVRYGDRLKAAVTNMEFLRNHISPLIYASDIHGLRSAHEAKNRILGSEMILRSALFRKESRGKQYREDYPYRDDPNWLAWVKIKNDHGEMKLSKNTLPRKIWAEKLLAIPYEERYPNRYMKEKV
ncbi:MAG: FAD-binding protein [Dehalococcoidales bacterium]|nr:FAD-binding protein [Dehalococcoidales bacterium]